MGTLNSRRRHPGHSRAERSRWPFAPGVRARRVFALAVRARRVVALAVRAPGVRAPAQADAPRSEAAPRGNPRVRPLGTASVCNHWAVTHRYITGRGPSAEPPACGVSGHRRAWARERVLVLRSRVDSADMLDRHVSSKLVLALRRRLDLLVGALLLEGFRRDGLATGLLGGLVCHGELLLGRAGWLVPRVYGPRRRPYGPRRRPYGTTAATERSASAMACRGGISRRNLAADSGGDVRRRGVLPDPRRRSRGTPSR